MPKVIDTTAYLDTVCALLREGHAHVPVTVAGTSMTPFLDPGDTVFLDLPECAVEKGDVILFRRRNSQYVLHRIVAIGEDGILSLLGDAQLRPEPVHPSQIRAVVTQVRRGEKLLTPHSLRWRFFRGPWQRCRRIRPYVNRIRNYFKK
jgi:signal peptidase I